VRRAAEDGAGAVFHQHEIGDVDRQLPVRVERVLRLEAGVEALLLGRLDLGLAGADALALGDEGGELRICAASARASGWSGAIATKLAPNSVSGRVVKTSSFDRSAAPASGSGSGTSRGLRSLPIQFSCISRTFSGQRSSVPAPSSSSSANTSVILRNHWLSLRRSTGAPERQPRPSITCSLASTVMSTGSQLTSAPCGRRARRERSRNSFCCAVIFGVAGRDLARPVERQPIASAARASRRCFVGPGLSRDGPCASRSRRSRPAGRTRPSPSGAAR
jgi:hypothetical protein